MEKTYSPQNIEQRWYKHWEEAGYFAPSGQGKAFCIMLPPPNVTGSLHMGHGFQHTLMDALTRYQRMCGRKVLWQPGTDHAGISTQMVVERQLDQENKTRHDLGRKHFVERIWHWKATSGGQITQQMRRLGASVDWSRERFTMDEGLSNAVQKVFISLYDEGLIYRGKRLVNWDPALSTAISDLEVTASTEQGKLWYLRYPLLHDNSQHLSIATTRPETLLGDVAVAVHPDDPRYTHLIGEYLAHPLTDRHIPIIADASVDPAFGTGVVKITPAHDTNDYALASRHDLPLLNIFNEDITLNTHVPAAYQGLHRDEARKQVLADLDKLGLVEKIVDHTLTIPRGEKSGAIIEPLLTDQWYVKVQPLAEPAIKAVENQEVNFVPDNWTKTYYQWMQNIEDWCISRQLWWGHRIPAWYDPKGNIYVAENEQQVREKYQLSKDIVLEQEEDVLDTWFSSSLWPFSTLGWPENTRALKTFYPSAVLVTGFDIIFFWVARMIMMGLKFTGDVPFHDVVITGLIRDSEGKKMSKSKGNVLDPIDLIDGIGLEDLLKKRTHNLMLTSAKQRIEKNTRKEFPEGIPAFGADALRFTFCALASTGRDIRFDMGRIEGYRNFCNKLWNASRYVLMNMSDENDDIGDGPLQHSLADTWILSRCQHTIRLARQYFTQYRFDLLASTLYEFTWREYCDWYLELSKPVLYDKNVPLVKKRGTRHVLIHVLETLLRLLHPLIPFITEEIWQKVAPLAGIKGDTLMHQTYPEADPSLQDHAVEANIDWLKQVVTAIRNIRSEMGIAPGQPIPALFHKGDASDKQRLKTHRHDLSNLAKLADIRWLSNEEAKPASATAIVGKLEIFIPMAGLIDVQAESERLHKTLDKLNLELARVQAKLNNPQFIDKAPLDVVNKEKEKLSALESKREKLQQQVKQLTQV